MEMNDVSLKELQLELTTYCNSNCIMCLRDRLEREQGMMNTEFAFDIIEQATNMGCELLKAYWFGESLLAYNWKAITTYAKARELRIMLVTNGSLMDKENRQHVLTTVDKVFFSIDSQDKDTYEKIRRGLHFDNVISNLKNLYQERKEMNSKTQIIVTAVELEENKFEIEGMKDFFKPMCDRFVLNKEVYCKPYDIKTREVICSHKVRNRLVVGWNGICYLCCHDWLGHYQIGDLRKQTIEEVWNGKERENSISNLSKLAICQQCMSLSGQ